MPAWEVLSVTPPPPPESGVAGAIEAPEPGMSGELHAMRLAGWVLGASERVGTIEVRAGNLLQTGRPRIDRPQVARSRGAQSPRCGFELTVGTLGLEPHFALDVDAILAQGGRVPLGRIEGRREPLRSSFEPRLQPLVVTSCGRSGSTLLMAMLKAHPGILVPGGYPFEVWQARHWMNAVKLLTDPSDHERSTRPLSLATDTFHLGRNPFHAPADYAQENVGEWLGRGLPEQTAGFAQRAIERWYEAVASDLQAPDPLYFAEKELRPQSLSRNLILELYPRAREVFIVRDFRDLALSWVSWRRRGRAPDARDKELEYVRTRFRTTVSRFAEAWRRSDGRALLVRYEDLVLAPEKALTALLGYLELPADDDTIAAMVASPSSEIPASHLTSDPVASVGRWERETDDELRTACDEALGEFLIEFGYRR